MTLLEQINADFIAAFKAKDMDKKNFLGVIKGEVQTQQGKGVEPTDANVVKIVKKMEKSLKEVGTDDSNRELSYLEPYLPKLLPEHEISRIMDEFIRDTPSANIGVIMGYFNKNYSGQVDNGLVSKLAKSKL